MRLIMIFIVCMIGISCNAQKKFSYKNIGEYNLKTLRKNQYEIDSIKSRHFKGAIDLTSYLPANYSRKGNIDYTRYLQNGIDENSIVLMPNFPILVNYLGLTLRSNSKIMFQGRSKLIVKANNEELYHCINIEGVKNLEVYFANIEGDRYTHRGETGEWGMGFFIRHSENIKIYKPIIKAFWGDGIYIGRDKGIVSNRITIEKALIDDNRRNGISVIACKNLLISNSLISNTNGTSPEFGIDLEPNTNTDILDNIVLANNTTYNNNKGGILLAFDYLKGKEATPIYIKVVGHTDNYSERGIEFAIDRSYNSSLLTLKGQISITDSRFNGNTLSILTNESLKSKIDLKLDNIYINNCRLNNIKIKSFIDNFVNGKVSTLNYD
jgi:hypothetical protein